jgi:isopenicillin N synthase-like dioxygenase
VTLPPSHADAVPRIDVSAIKDGVDATRASREVQDQMRNACREIGFMTVTGHGIPREQIEETATAARRFFELPEAAKLAIAPRRWNSPASNVYRGYFPSSAAGKEGLDLGEPRQRDAALLERPYHEQNRLPPGLDREWADTITGYFDAASSLAGALLRALVGSLGGAPDRVGAAFARPASLSTLRFNFYPAREHPIGVSPDDGAQLSCESHIDSGLLTLLYQDARGGLQVRGSDRRWHFVEPDPDAFVVNTGLALQRMTGGSLAATEHRVLYGRGSRLSIPFFFEPEPDFIMDASSLGLPFPPAQSPQSYEGFLRDSLAKFPEYDRGDPESSGN